MRRIDHSSRGVLPNVARRVWSRNLENEEAKARYRAVKIQPQWVVTPGKQTNHRCKIVKLVVQQLSINWVKPYTCSTSPKFTRNIFQWWWVLLCFQLHRLPCLDWSISEFSSRTKLRLFRRIIVSIERASTHRVALKLLQVKTNTRKMCIPSTRVEFEHLLPLYERSILNVDDHAAWIMCLLLLASFLSVQRPD
jgi:hypothetical protein